MTDFKLMSRAIFLLSATVLLLAGYVVFQGVHQCSLSENDVKSAFVETLDSYEIMIIE